MTSLERQRMSKIHFSKFIQKKETRLLLEKIIYLNNSYFIIEDVNNKLLLGQGKSQADRVPITFNKELLGWLSADHDKDTPLCFIEHLLAKEAEKKDIIKETLGLYKEVNLLYKLSDKIKANFNLEEIANSIINEATCAIRSTYASVVLYNSKKNTLETIASLGIDKSTKMDFPIDKGIVGYVFSSGHAEIVNNTFNDIRFVQDCCPIGSLLCAPIKAGNKTVGVINLSHSTIINYNAADLKLFCALISHGEIALENALLHEKIIKEKQVKNHLERYVSAKVVDAIMKCESDLIFQPEKRCISILFSDIRGFTHLCESLDSAEVVKYLNTYFENMVDIIFNQQGTINKFVGDMIVALFGAPEYLTYSEKHTVAAAISMQHWLKTTEHEWIKENFKTGIGINSGKVVVGNIGSPKHMDYTAIGDEMNLASRLQSIATAGQILVSRSIYEATQDSFEFCYHGRITVKGREQPTDVFEVIY